MDCQTRRAVLELATTHLLARVWSGPFRLSGAKKIWGSGWNEIRRILGQVNKVELPTMSRSAESRSR